MSKKLLFVLALLMPLCAVADGVGSWRFHPAYDASELTNIVDAGDWVYYLSAGNLFRLDQSTGENESLSKVNDLSDISVSQIYYNWDKKYLVVVYANSNIDVILSSGSVVNMSEIKDAVMTWSKTINDVTFADGLMYVATDFGYVVIDDDQFVVKESRIWGTSIASAAQVGNRLMLVKGSDLYYGPANIHYEALGEMEVLTGTMDNSLLRPAGSNGFFALSGWTYYYTASGSDDNMQLSQKVIAEARTTSLQRMPSGYMLNVPADSCCYVTDEQGNVTSTVKTGGELCSSNPSGDGTVWALGAKGVHKRGDENYYKPNALSFGSAFWMTYNQTLDQLYVSTTATNHFFTENKASQINTYDGSTWRDVTPAGMPKTGTYWIDFDKTDANTYFIGGWTTGLFKVTNNEIAVTYNANNSPMVKKSGAMHAITTLDRSGNVWVVQSYENSATPVMVLPAAKAQQNEVTANDWNTPSISSAYTGYTKRASFLATKQTSTDVMIFTDGDYMTPITMWVNGGVTEQNPTQRSFTSFTDQDGGSFSWTYPMCIAEDLNGTVWMGFKEGVISFNPANAFSTGFTINHIKVPRNDGTGMADYLMDGIQVNSIAVDGANRKWIATQNSGLFLVSSDGTEIISQFNTSNSPMASNTVYRVCVNPNSNSVYITTPEGLYEYLSDSSPAMSDYSNIYAYPNPVRPDYGGMVTITGLMDNSLIKIADAGGNVIKQLKSTGGMTTWDCADQNGDRVPTGVYFVIASQANGGGEAVVTKIAIVR